MIVGLGNPGEKYEKTRHNTGFMAIDILARENGITISKKECHALTGKGMIKDQNVLLVKPQTFMNNSGQAVIELINYYDTIDDLLIIYDDMDLPVGSIRFKQKGSAGGHNGIKSIISHLNSQEFDRLKVGIGHDEHRETINHVLSRFKEDEWHKISQIMGMMNDICYDWLKDGIVSVMNKYN